MSRSLAYDLFDLEWQQHVAYGDDHKALCDVWHGSLDEFARGVVKEYLAGNEFIKQRVEGNMSDKIKITYRGWGGHFILGHRCRFRLNTLVEVGEQRVVVSTVGLLPNPLKEGEWMEIGCGRHYETMAFIAKEVDLGYGKVWDADVQKPVDFSSLWAWPEVEDELNAQAGHEAVVAEIVEMAKAGPIRSDRYEEDDS